MSNNFVNLLNGKKACFFCFGIDRVQYQTSNTANFTTRYENNEILRQILSSRVGVGTHQLADNNFHIVVVVVASPNG